MIVVKRTSPLSGKVHTMEIPLTDWQFSVALERWEAGELIQNAFPTLSADEREFIKTGITPAEWESTFVWARTD